MKGKYMKRIKKIKSKKKKKRAGDKKMKDNKRYKPD
jgi:hypothetical protein